MITYLDRSRLCSILAERRDPASKLAAEALAADPSIELVPVKDIRPRDMVHTYEVRLGRVESGSGPKTTGLTEFVHALRANTAARLAHVSAGGVNVLCLLDLGDSVIAVTTVEEIS
jgi:hypothetical protein